MASELHTGEELYHGFDADGLERQYSLRPTHPDRDEYYAAYTAESERFRAAAGGEYDVPYGDAERQRLDIFPGAPGKPVFIFFHGGYWRALDKSIFSFLVEPFWRAGWNCVLPNYSLAPSVTIDVIVEQAIEAVRWTANRFSKTPGLVIGGHSAGGHLTAMCALAHARSPFPMPVLGGIPISGIFDLEPIRRTSINDLVKLTPESAFRNSPINLIAPSDVPLLLVTGANETEEFRAQSVRFAKQWQASGNEAEVCCAPGTHHFSVLRDFADPASGLHSEVDAFLRRAAPF